MDQAWGIQKPNIGKGPTKPEKLFIKLDDQVRKLLDISKQEFLSFSQNATTSLIYSLLPILEQGDYKIYIGSQEIRWVAGMFEKGKLPTNECTYPNYAKLEKVPFLKKPFNIFDPKDLINNPKKTIGRKPCIIIFSHISRVTGETFASQKLYSAIKKLNKENIVVVDGCQAVGATLTKPNRLSDIYVGVTSKFIGAEPHIGFAWIKKEIVKRFNIKPWRISPTIFSKEIYSAVRALNKLEINPRRTLIVRKAFEGYLRVNNVEFFKGINQAAHILIVLTRKSLKKTIQTIKTKGYTVSPNTGWSIKEPYIKGVRISLTPRTPINQLKIFANVLGSMKKSGLL